MVNPHAVLEDIAKITNTPISKVAKIVRVEYWKDMVNFSHRNGALLLADYVKVLGIKELKPLSDEAGFDVPLLRFQEIASPTQKVLFYINVVYTPRVRAAISQKT